VVELNRADEWPAFFSRMRQQFEQLVESKPTCLDDIVQALGNQNESITFLDVMRDRLAGVKDADLHDLAPQMQRHGYYASVQGRAKNNMILCSLRPRQLRCSPKQI
jgi:hypothetical protein